MKNKESMQAENPSVEAVVDSTVIPEIQAVLDEVETELTQEASQELKKIIKSRLQKIKQLEGDLAKEKAAFAALVQMNKNEYDRLKGSASHILKSADWGIDNEITNPSNIGKRLKGWDGRIR